MAHYFASDIHLRSDQPDRGRRFTDFVSTLKGGDSLRIVGDLCDFWMGSRTSESEMSRADGLTALVDFQRRGGLLTVMLGNHDLWLGPFYERALGAAVVAEPLDLVVEGLRIRLVHGHLLGARAPWKGIMESRAFFHGFGLVPEAAARRLDAMLARKNSRQLLADEERHLKVYRTYVQDLGNQADLVVIGHVHRPVDESVGDARMIVLGGWQNGSSHLKIDESGAVFSVHRDTARAAGVPTS